MSSDDASGSHFSVLHWSASRNLIRRLAFVTSRGDPLPSPPRFKRVSPWRGHCFPRPPVARCTALFFGRDRGAAQLIESSRSRTRKKKKKKTRTDRDTRRRGRSGGDMSSTQDGMGWDGDGRARPTPLPQGRQSPGESTGRPLWALGCGGWLGARGPDGWPLLVVRRLVAFRDGALIGKI